MPLAALRLLAVVLLVLSASARLAIGILLDALSILIQATPFSIKTLLHIQ